MHPFIHFFVASSLPLTLTGEEATAGSKETKPIFTEKPVIKQADDGSKITFECKLISDPLPTIEWLLQGKTVKEGPRHSMSLTTDKGTHLVSLEIKKVTPSDTGEYKIVAKNKLGEGTATINLNFDKNKPALDAARAPRFPMKPTIKQIGPDLLLQCILEGDPIDSIIWYHGDNQVKEDARHKITKKQLSKTSYELGLLVVDPDSKDGGMYRCFASNQYGDSNANIALNFQEEEEEEEEEDLSPTFVDSPKITQNNGIVLMECSVRSTTKITTTWYRESTKLVETTRIKSSVTESKKEIYAIRLEISVMILNEAHSYSHAVKKTLELPAATAAAAAVSSHSHFPSLFSWLLLPPYHRKFVITNACVFRVLIIYRLFVLHLYYKTHGTVRPVF